MINIEKDLIKKILKEEDLAEDIIEKHIQQGYAVMPQNIKHILDKPCVIGKGLKTKVNANIGLSPGHSNVDLEMKKMETAVKAGADAVMDLSTGPQLRQLRQMVLAECPVPLGTVPVYQIACDRSKQFKTMTEDDFIDVLYQQAEEGVDFFTIHSGITLQAASYIKENTRILNVVSRGGALIASWMNANNRENPFFSRFDDVIKIAKKYNIVLSLGDSLRPGSICDATDRLQVQELLILGDQQKKALANDVQVMIEGPGHVKLDEIESNVKLQKSICNGAPFYVLGPLVTDAAPGYDHIVGAIGGAIAAWHGADFLCYVTPAEHLRLPVEDDVRRGVIASKIAAHAADIVKNIPSAFKQDMEISKARAKRDWKRQFELAIDPVTPLKVREEAVPKEDDVCSMCEDFCSIKVLEESLKNPEK